MLVPARPSCPRRCARWTGANYAGGAKRPLGAQVTPQESGLYLVDEDGGREWTRLR